MLHDSDLSLYRRLAGCLELLILSIISLVTEEDEEQETHTFAPWDFQNPRRLAHAAMCVTYVRVHSSLEN
jgi:hypothetical protein